MLNGGKCKLLSLLPSGPRSVRANPERVSLSVKPVSYRCKGQKWKGHLKRFLIQKKRKEKWKEGDFFFFNKIKKFKKKFWRNLFLIKSERKKTRVLLSSLKRKCWAWVFNATGGLAGFFFIFLLQLLVTFERETSYNSCTFKAFSDPVYHLGGVVVTNVANQRTLNAYKRLCRQIGHVLNWWDIRQRLAPLLFIYKMPPMSFLASCLPFIQNSS